MLSAKLGVISSKNGGILNALELHDIPIRAANIEELAAIFMDLQK